MLDYVGGFSRTDVEGGFDMCRNLSDPDRGEVSVTFSIRNDRFVSLEAVMPSGERRTMQYNTKAPRNEADFQAVWDLGRKLASRWLAEEAKGA